MKEAGEHFSGEGTFIRNETRGDISDSAMIEALRLDCACSGESNVSGQLLSEGDSASVIVESTVDELRAEWILTGHA